MQREKLAVTKRTVLGKKIKKLRRDGILPANIYGKGIKSLAVQAPIKEFNTVYSKAGETGLIDLQIDGEVRPVLIHNVQLDHIAKTPLHADFYQVNLKEKVKTMVPIVTVGEPKAVTEKVGLLLQPLAEIEIEALPTDLPEKIEVPVEALGAVDEQITVANLKIPESITVLTDPEQVVIKIGELVSKEAQEQAAAEAAAAEAAKVASDATKAEAAATEGAPVQEGAPVVEGKVKPTTTEDTKKKEPQKDAKPEEKPQ